MIYLAVGILNVVLVAMLFTAIWLLRDPSPKALARRAARLEKKTAKRAKKAAKAGISLEEPAPVIDVASVAPVATSPAMATAPTQGPAQTVEAVESVVTNPVPAVLDLRGTPEAQPMLANTIVVQPAHAPEPQVPETPTTQRRFVPGGPLMEDGSVPDFSLSVSHLFTHDNGVQSSTRRRSTIDPIKLSIQAGARPVTPLLERVVQAMVDIGLEPTQTRPLVHSFMDANGRSARVRLGHTAALGDLIEIEIEPSLSPAAMASVMQLLAELDFDPSDTTITRPAKG